MLLRPCPCDRTVPHGANGAARPDRGIDMHNDRNDHEHGGDGMSDRRQSNESNGKAEHAAPEDEAGNDQDQDAQC